MDYKKKYLKYKLKYLNTKKTLRGGGIWDWYKWAFAPPKTPEEKKKEKEEIRKGWKINEEVENFLPEGFINFLVGIKDKTIEDIKKDFENSIKKENMEYNQLVKGEDLEEFIIKYRHKIIDIILLRRNNKRVGQLTENFLQLCKKLESEKLKWEELSENIKNKAKFKGMENFIGNMINEIAEEIAKEIEE